MIKIICGEFGLKRGNSIILKTVKDEQFIAPDEVEKRLVKNGIAEYVLEKTNDIEGPSYDETTSFDKLKEIAIRLGATADDLKGKNSKVKLKELIEELKKPEENTPEDGENDGEKDGEDSNGNAPEDENNDGVNTNEETPEDGENNGDNTPDFSGDDGVVD